MDAHRSLKSDNTLRQPEVVMAPERLGAMHQKPDQFCPLFYSPDGTEKVAGSPTRLAIVT